MKPIYVILIAVGTGIAGFITGGGIGLWGGAVGGGLAGGFIGSATGACMAVDTATTIGVLTPDQAEKVGIKIGQDFKAKGMKLDSLSVAGTTPSCDRMIQGIVKAGK
ncbi:hypothetical protein HC931_14520 [Candidatus Gracilibacteria bacterium]|jgi:hypothetical protein|nr:hypothetical protein [Candidatus Gracilibacteria bacterium]NJM87811.1 hypothetical protein [Hydrococcus sp. RU_2_2]NJP21291.1 hypothetical protein [Hydrococcus sp. CRU_1_1]